MPILWPVQGSTRLLLTKIPFFKEIIISSFTCPHCNWTNSEIQSAGRIQDQGVLYTLQVKTKEVRTVNVDHTVFRYLLYIHVGGMSCSHIWSLSQESASSFSFCAGHESRGCEVWQRVHQNSTTWFWNSSFHTEGL